MQFLLHNHILSYNLSGQFCHICLLGDQQSLFSSLPNVHLLLFPISWIFVFMAFLAIICSWSTISYPSISFLMVSLKPLLNFVIAERTFFQVLTVQSLSPQYIFLLSSFVWCLWFKLCSLQRFLSIPLLAFK